MPAFSSRSLRPILLPLALLLLAIAVYWGALDNGFSYWDDEGYVLDNPHIREFSLANLQWMLTNTSMGYWGPLLWLSYAANYAMAGNAAWIYQWTDVVLHGLNAIWVFWLSLALYALAVGQRFNRAALSQPAKPALIAGFSAALLFILHPQHVEAVAWIAARKDTLSLFFLLPALLAYVQYTQSRSAAWYALSLLCFILAITAKPTAVTLPAALILLDAYPLRRLQGSGWRLFATTHNYRLALWEKLPFWIAAGVGAYMPVRVVEEIKALDLYAFSSLQTLLDAASNLWFYLSKFILPLPLSPIYPGRSVGLPEGLAAVAGIVLATVLFIYLAYRRQPWWLIAWLWLIASLSPVLGFIQYNPLFYAADRYAYYPTLPLYVLLGATIGWKVAWNQRRQAALWLVVLGLWSLTAYSLARQQIEVWHGPFSLWGKVLELYPDHAPTHAALGNTYRRLGQQQQAIAAYQRAIALQPKAVGYYERMAYAYLEAGQADKARELLEYVETHAVGDSGKEPVLFNLALLHCQAERLDKAREYAGKTLALAPQHPSALLLYQAIAADATTGVLPLCAPRP